MGLREAAREAERYVDARAWDAVEAALEAAAPHVPAEADVDVLARFAELCHAWGSLEVEELVMRALLRRRPDLDTRRRLLDVLQQRLEQVQGEELRQIATECIALGTEALRDVQPGSGLDWSNLVEARGLRHLDLVRLGDVAHADLARADLEAHAAWLRDGQTVPEHLQRDNLIAISEIALGELLVLEDRLEQAARRLEEALQTLESNGGAGPWRARVHSLLELTR